MSSDAVNWVAPDTGHDWRDDDVLLATEWFASLVDGGEMAARLERTEAFFQDARRHWLTGNLVPLFDKADVAAWMIFQGRAFADHRENWVPEEAVRFVPTLTRIGKELPALLAVHGAEERAARLMTADRAQVEAGLFELLVALAYKRHGWRNVAFVPERPGISKTPDLLVDRPRSHWAVECKRLARSGYAAEEYALGDRLAASVHELALAANRSLVVRVAFEVELENLGDGYLSDRVEAYLANPGDWNWDTRESLGYVRDVDWRLAHRVMAKDDVYFGSSRMIELIAGRYDHGDDHSMAAKWRPSTRPFYASALYQASVVSWRSVSMAAARRKARHFKSIVAKAAAQLPGDRPGVVHVGTETWGNARIDQLRHIQNILELGDFDPGSSRLRWVYGNYTAPELTTDANETWALNETMIPYRIGRHSTAWPLPGHLLVSPDDEAHPGVHW